jgi:tetratricopeptide (TPR) repeat protein
MILVVADRLDEATEMFREALEADSTDLDARANLGSIHLMMRNHNEAVSEFEALIELARHRYDGHVGLGLALVQLGKFDNGISAFTNAIRLRPEHTLSYCELGRAYMNAGEMDRAMESTKVALKLAPDIYGGNLLLQQLLVKMGRFDAAVKECRSYLARHEDAEVYYNLATAYALSGDRESALHELRRAIQLGGHLRFRAKDDRTFELLRDSRRFNDLLAGKPGLF